MAVVTSRDINLYMKSSWNMHRILLRQKGGKLIKQKQKQNKTREFEFVLLAQLVITLLRNITDNILESN